MNNKCEKDNLFSKAIRRGERMKEGYCEKCGKETEKGIPVEGMEQSDLCGACWYDEDIKRQLKPFSTSRLLAELRERLGVEVVGLSSNNVEFLMDLLKSEYLVNDREGEIYWGDIDAEDVWSVLEDISERYDSNKKLKEGKE